MPKHKNKNEAQADAKTQAQAQAAAKRRRRQEMQEDVRKENADNCKIPGTQQQQTRIDTEASTSKTQQQTQIDAGVDEGRHKTNARHGHNMARAPRDERRQNVTRATKGFDY